MRQKFKRAFETTHTRIFRYISPRTFIINKTYFSDSAKKLASQIASRTGDDPIILWDNLNSILYFFRIEGFAPNEYGKLKAKVSLLGRHRNVTSLDDIKQRWTRKV